MSALAALRLVVAGCLLMLVYQGSRAALVIVLAWMMIHLEWRALSFRTLLGVAAAFASSAMDAKAESRPWWGDELR